jgi:hypothetical protein
MIRLKGFMMPATQQALPAENVVLTLFATLKRLSETLRPTLAIVARVVFGFSIVFGSSVYPLALEAAECATPVAPSQLQTRAPWTPLERFEASKSLNPVIGTVQTTAAYGVGQMNNDFYSITVDAKTDTPESLANFLRTNLDRLVFGGTTYSFSAYDSSNELTWKSSQPKGSVMTFVLASLSMIGVGGPEIKASVVMSCQGASSWIFSTVETPKDGWHPVSGNRSFGVTKNNDGSLSIWTKGADRAVNAGAVGLVHVHSAEAREQTFLQGHQVWMRLLNNLSDRLKDRNPRNRVEFSVRRAP